MDTKRTKEILSKAQAGAISKHDALVELKKESCIVLTQALATAIENGTLKVVTTAQSPGGQGLRVKHEALSTETVMNITASIATPESDAKIAERERSKGAQAKREGKPPEACPWDPNSLVGHWWREGYENPLAGAIGIPLGR